MEKSIISEGKTTAKAIENGLKVLKVSKDMVDVKVIESEEKRSFFSILAPRIVKVEITVKENVKKVEEKTVLNKEHKEAFIEHKEHAPKKLSASEDEVKQVISHINEFLTEFFEKLNVNDAKFEVNATELGIDVNISGENLSYLIGYRGDVMKALQVILTSIASKYSKEKIKVLVDIENYREKRKKSLEELAEKIAKTVMKTKKSITLEPMTPYERKIIHSKLQENPNVKTFSTGIEPRRKVVVALK